ncbi:MAG: hypothetical protein ACRYG7_11270 [Janthinobacterium lividum]
MVTFLGNIRPERGPPHWAGVVNTSPNGIAVVQQAEVVSASVVGLAKPPQLTF